MKICVSVFLIIFLSACSLSIPQKPSAGSIWHFSPTPAPAQEKRPAAIVVAKPWLASGYDTNQVLVTIDNSERDVLADVAWADTHGEWLRNYFIEGLQSSGAFTAVSGNQNLHDRLLFLRLYIWDLSVHYEDSSNRVNPVVKAKLAITVTNGRGQKLADQQIIEAQAPVAENRQTPIMLGFRQVIEECFKKTSELLATL